MPKLSEFVNENLIKIGLRARKKKDVLKELVEFLKERGIIDKTENFLKALKQRENIETTAIGKGVAIPHAKCSDVKKMFLLIAVSHEGVDFKSVDGKPVNLIFLVGDDGKNENLYIQLLAKIARLLKTEDLRERLKKAANPQEVMKVVEEFDKKVEEIKVKVKSGRVIRAKEE